MRTEPPSPSASALARLRGLAGRLRRWLAARGAIARVGLLLVGLGVLVGAGYLATINDPGEPAWSWICERRKLSSDDVDRISETLDGAGITHVADSLGRIGVKQARRAEAIALLVKAKAIPPTLGELSNDADLANPWETREDRERRDNHALEERLKFKIERLDPAIRSADVKIRRVRKRPGPGPASDVSASVYLETEGGRELGHRVVAGIQRFLTGDVPDLKPEAITAIDHTGHAYLAAGDPTLKAEMQAHAREEDWQDKVLEELRHIPGLGVAVLLEAVPEPIAAPELPPPVALEMARPNAQVDLIDHGPSPFAPAPPAPASRIKANVWVRVPRSFYLLEFQSRSPGRQPSQEDLEPMRLTTEKVIRDAIEIHIPKDELGVVKIDVIQDDLASTRPILLPLSQEPSRPWTWMALSGGISAAGLLAVAGLVRLANRRPSARPSRSAWRAGFVADGPSGPVPGPSERVRELIRLNPEAAAGVLQRWIGQGGALE